MSHKLALERTPQGDTPTSNFTSPVEQLPATLELSFPFWLSALTPASSFNTYLWLPVTNPATWAIPAHFFHCSVAFQLPLACITLEPYFPELSVRLPIINVSSRTLSNTGFLWPKRLWNSVSFHQVSYVCQSPICLPACLFLLINLPIGSADQSVS